MRAVLRISIAHARDSSLRASPFVQNDSMLLKNVLYDENRAAVLTQNGITVLRFTNADIEHRFDTVCDEIGRQAEQNANNPGGIE